MNEIRTTKIDGQEFVTLTDYPRLKEEKQELEYLWDINEELKEENKKLKERFKKLEKELWARVKQVEDLQSSYKVLQDENKKLKSKLEQTVDEYDE